MKNLIICAAIVTKCGKIFRGHRHHNAIRAATESHCKVHPCGEAWSQGFITSKNEYVSREEAMKIHRKSGQTPAENGRYYEETKLYSEDLY